jgi:hypothetical protein
VTVVHGCGYGLVLMTEQCSHFFNVMISNLVSGQRLLTTSPLVSGPSPLYLICKLSVEVPIW